MQESQTAAGHDFVSIHISDVMLPEEARHLLSAFQKGGLYNGRPVIAVLEEDSEVPAGTRIVLSSFKPEYLPVAAVVVPNFALRMVVTFLTKFIGHQDLSLFSTKEEAVEWFDARVGGAAFHSRTDSNNAGISP